MGVEVSIIQRAYDFRAHAYLVWTFDGGAPWLLGVSSHQFGQGEAGISGVYGVREYYTRVSYYQDWFAEYIPTPSD